MFSPELLKLGGLRRLLLSEWLGEVDCMTMPRKVKFVRLCTPLEPAPPAHLKNFYRYEVEVL